jgi:hypothetical protein
MSVNTVPRSIDQAITETVQKRIFVGEADVLLNPSLTPIFTLVTKIGNRKKSVASSRVEWIEDDYVGHWGQVSNGTTDYSSVATSINVVDGTLFAAGDLIAIPKVASNSSAEEVARVTAVNSNTLTLTRGIGGAGADTIGATADIRILASAYAEGAAYGTVRNTTKAVKISYTQIFRRPVTITKSMVAQAQFGPSNERLFQRRKALEEHRKEIESAGLWSRASESLALGAPGTVRTTMGLKSRIVTNVYNANTTLTESGLESFAELAFGTYYQGTEKLLVAAKKVISAFDFFALGHQRTQQAETLYGVKVKRYVTSHGDFMITRDLMLENSPNSGLGWGDEAYALDVDSIEFAPLSGNGENRDTHLLTDVVKDGSDKYSDEYITEGAWVIRFEQRHARMYNVSAFA